MLTMWRVREHSNHANQENNNYKKYEAKQQREFWVRQNTDDTKRTHTLAEEGQMTAARTKQHQREKHTGVSTDKNRKRRKPWATKQESRTLGVENNKASCLLQSRAGALATRFSILFLPSSTAVSTASLRKWPQSSFLDWCCSPYIIRFVLSGVLVSAHQEDRPLCRQTGRHFGCVGDSPGLRQGQRVNRLILLIRNRLLIKGCLRPALYTGIS